MEQKAWVYDDDNVAKKVFGPQRQEENTFMVLHWAGYREKGKRDPNNLQRKRDETIIKL